MNNPSESDSPVPAPFPQEKKKPSCWLIGGLGCLVIFLLVGGIGGYLFYKGMQMVSKPGGMLSKITSMAGGEVTTEKQMGDVRTAILSYHSANGRYPKNLKQLVPTYIASVSQLHSSLDSNPDPSSISFAYAKPGPHTPRSSPVLSVTWVINLGMSGSQPPPQNYLTDTLDGDMELSMYMNGQQISKTPVTNPAGPPP